MWVLSARCSAVCLGGVLPWPFNAAEVLFYHFVVDPTRKYPEFVLVSSARKSLWKDQICPSSGKENSLGAGMALVFMLFHWWFIRAFEPLYRQGYNEVEHKPHMKEGFPCSELVTNGL